MRLCVFDFDGTLFASPVKPNWWKNKVWWEDERSLEPPCVPAVPGDEWWNTGVVSAAKSAMANNDTVTVLLTGRRNWQFNDRIYDLLSQKGLAFDEVRLCPIGMDTFAFKATWLQQALEDDSITAVEMWDDRKSYLEGYAAICDDSDVSFIPHGVTKRVMSVACGPDALTEVWMSTSPVAYKAGGLALGPGYATGMGGFNFVRPNHGAFGGKMKRSSINVIKNNPVKPDASLFIDKITADRDREFSTTEQRFIGGIDQFKRELMGATDAKTIENMLRDLTHDDETPGSHVIDDYGTFSSQLRSGNIAAAKHTLMSSIDMWARRMIDYAKRNDQNFLGLEKYIYDSDGIARFNARTSWM